MREIGIRMALGADRVGVVRMVMKRGMALALSGVGIGLLLCMAVDKAIASSGVASFNVPLIALVAAALVAVGALGAYIPARRASLVDPIGVLRQE
jgi:ABC-type antimicrobial peptide transport system permease subunit